MPKPKFLKREKQQVWIYWDFATEQEKRYTMKRNLEEPHGLSGALVQSGAHETSVQAADELNRTKQITRLENLVAEAAKRKGHLGITWNEASEATGLGKGSTSPRFKPLRHRLLLAFALEQSPNGQQPQKGIDIDFSDW